MDKLAGIAAAGLTEGLKEPVKKDLRLTFLIAGDVFLAPRNELAKLIPIRHGKFLHEEH